MKCSESWLKEWVKPKQSLKEVCERLTMAGLEVESITQAADNFNRVIVGLVRQVDLHPEAERLKICEVVVGAAEPLTIVCAAENVRVGMKAPVAMINAKLPGNKLITPTTIRGVASFGMLCSAADLGMAVESTGLLELSAEAKVGADLRQYLGLDDSIIDISITPNRGDCLSIQGIAREVAALTHARLKHHAIPTVRPRTKDKLPIVIKAKNACPRYVGRVIRGVKADLTTPEYMRERLRRSGIRSISPIVDVTNYVMLELGQPMHAFDLNTIDKQIQVRWSKAGETIDLLDGSKHSLNAETLVIADRNKPLAIAGVMGGLDSCVTLLTRDIFLESAYFAPTVIAKQRQAYQLHSDSAYRFERSVDPALQRVAIERATQLVLELVGGVPGPVVEVTSQSHLPKSQPIQLEASMITKVLGVEIPAVVIEKIFAGLQFSYKRLKNSWKVLVPSYRSDLSIPEDLIEEIARVYGYDKIPTNNMRLDAQLDKLKENSPCKDSLRLALLNQGFHEIVAYSFVDKKLQALLDPNEIPRELLNPISTEMSVMRTSLWPGLVNTLLYNVCRQQARIRLFETGLCFTTQGKKLLQEERVAGLIYGSALPEQWGMPSRKVDFFDLKGDLENVLSSVRELNDYQFKSETHPALHPGQSASIHVNGEKIGIIGVLHPSIKQELGLPEDVVLFECQADTLLSPRQHQFQEVSKFPEVRRDLALLINEAVSSEDIQSTIVRSVGDWLKDIFVFDVYQGKGISPGVKSVALALILQHPSRTLVDDEVAGLMQKVVTALKGAYGAELRS